MRPCAHCGNDFQPPVNGGRAKFCSSKCRSAHHRASQRPGHAGGSAPRLATVRSATLTRLSGARLSETPEGRAALALAERIDKATEVVTSGSAFAALVRELRATLAGIFPVHPRPPEPATDLQPAERPADLIEDLKKRRDERRRNQSEGKLS